MKSAGGSSQLQSGLSSMQSALVGQTQASGLASLKYYVTSIQICESMEVQGSGFSNTQGCLQIYEGETNEAFDYKDPTQDFVSQAAAARASDEGFINLLDADSRAKLATATTVSADDARSYNWGLINWYLPIKVKADIEMSDGTVLYTHDGTTTSRAFTGGGGGGAGYNYTTTASTAFTQGPSDEAVVMLPNGGTWFRFQNPLVIGTADVDAATEFDLDLAFNPEGLVKANSSGATNGPPLVDAEGRSIEVPFLDVSPIPHRANETVVRQTYVGNVGGTSAFDIRLEFYTVKEDASATLYGVAVTSLATSLTGLSLPTLPRASFVETAADGSFTLQDWAKRSIISGFQRQTEIGAETAASVHCSQELGVRIDLCSGSTSVTFALVSETEL